jgi:ADP-heptose:LPS heptosyltransferase
MQVKTPARILILRGGAIGDLVLTLPVFRALRSHFPQARIELLGYPRIAVLAAPWLDGIRAIEDRGLTGYFVLEGPLNQEWSDYFASFDTIISYLSDPEAVFLRNLRRCSLARFIQGPHRPNEAIAQHATECLLEPLKELDIDRADPEPRLDWNQIGPANAPPRSSTSSRLAVHPGSGSMRKNWPIAKWKALFLKLQAESRLQLLLVAGEAELNHLDYLLEGLDPSYYRLAVQLPLIDLAHQFTECAGYVGHDSGITHLAAAIGLPGLVLWGPSNSTVWRPRSNIMKMIQDPDGLEHLSVQTVWQSLQQACPFLIL